MKYKWPLMLGALAVAAWLALFGDKTPADAGAEVQPVASAASPRAASGAADEPQRLRSWAPRDPAALQSWLVASNDPFRALGAAGAASASAAGSAPQAETVAPFSLLGRGQVESGRETVFVQVGHEIQGLQVGSRVSGLQVLAIEREALLMLQLKTRETLRLPLGAPTGVFDQPSSP